MDSGPEVLGLLMKLLDDGLGEHVPQQHSRVQGELMKLDEEACRELAKGLLVCRLV